MNPRRPLSLVLLGASLSLGACATPPPEADNHWYINNVQTRMAYHFGGYERDEEEDYLEQLRGDRDHVLLSLRRHFMNDNPTNPLQPRILPRPKPPEPPQPPGPEFETEG